MNVSATVCGSLGLVLALAAASVGAQVRVYRWVDANGVVHYSDAPPQGDASNISSETVVVPPLPFGAPSPPRAQRTEPARVDTDEPAEPQAFTAPGEIQGADCSTASPLKSSGRDLYELNYDPPPALTTEEIEAFEAVIESMAYRWSGTDVGFACDGDTRRALSRDVVTEGRATSPVQFVLDSTISDRDSNRRELLRIEVRDDRLWVNGGYASLRAVSPRTLEFGYVERRGGLVTERQWRIDLDGRRAMNVEQVTYANGALSESSRWETTKPY